MPALLIFAILFSFAACGGGSKTTETTTAETTKASFTGNWPRTSIMADLPVLVDDADSIEHELDQPAQGNEYYIIYVKSISYSKFYDYIYELEAQGFNYPGINLIPDLETQTLGKKIEWAADNGKLWITCTWNSPAYVNPSSGKADENQLMLVVRNYGAALPGETSADAAQD